MTKTRAAATRDRMAKKRANKAADAGIVVRRSRVQGRGVFATRDFKRGDRVCEYRGERISHDEATERYDDEEMKRHHTFLFGVDDELCIDGMRGGNDARFINHSCDPNAYARIERRRVFIYAKRAIRAGDEIFYDYWYSTDEGYSLDDLKRLYPCRCGSPKCRGTLASVKKPRAATKSATKKKSEPLPLEASP